MRIHLAIVLCLISAPALAEGVAQTKTVECYCTDKSGSRVELGEMTCLQVDGKMFMAQCQMSLNVPMWRKITDGCLSSSLPHRGQPTLHAGLVDAHI
ncbi:hypothetical protein SAMN05421666_1753 [Roseovarius nanhaiticus]|uniref:Uncharacterized protein n=1 Tax=Roseovarius nanhaiticus TaxID=573024 RepID=A0A1N7G7Q7_9RHOB|nr:hypothetical protein [Roseovarius nanhaiticus]SEK34884.1 hypothetical protein SAMN05216208_0383 [Roseovarius nanhaiticus]SIS08620.1 hypothetical protein SAMN05421666_1753 [Roseovarius nanhaiticus]